MRRQFAWNFAAQAAGLVLPPLLLISLARVLGPSDFGVFALITMILAAIQTVTIGPLGEVVIRSEREDIGHFVFTAQLFIGLFWAAVLFLAADWISLLFDKPDLAAPLRVSSIILFIAPSVNIAIQVSMRKIAFKAVFVRRVITPLANACVSIPLALQGLGYWALVWGQIAGYVAAAIVIIGLGGWFPRLNFKVGKSFDDLKFSGQMVLQGLVRWIRNQSDRAILGFHMPLSEVGEYDMGRKLASLPFNAVAQPVAQVLYAIMSKRHRLGEDIRTLYLMSQRRVLMMSAPLAVMLILNAEGLVLGILGNNWTAIVPIFAILALVGGLSVVVSGNIEVFKAKGVPKTMTQFMVVRGAATIPVFLWLAPKGIYALSLGVLGLALFFFPINVFITMRLLGVKFWEYIREVILRPVIIALGVGVVNFALLQLSIPLFLGTFINLAIGGLIVLAAGYYWERDLFKWKRS